MEPLVPVFLPFERSPPPLESDDLSHQRILTLPRTGCRRPILIRRHHQMSGMSLVDSERTCHELVRFPRLFRPPPPFLPRLGIVANTRHILEPGWYARIPPRGTPKSAPQQRTTLTLPAEVRRTSPPAMPFGITLFQLPRADANRQCCLLFGPTQRVRLPREFPPRWRQASRTAHHRTDT